MMCLASHGSTNRLVNIASCCTCLTLVMADIATVKGWIMCGQDALSGSQYTHLKTRQPCQAGQILKLGSLQSETQQKRAEEPDLSNIQFLHLY